MNSAELNWLEHDGNLELAMVVEYLSDFNAEMLSDEQRCLVSECREMLMVFVPEAIQEAAIVAHRQWQDHVWRSLQAQVAKPE